MYVKKVGNYLYACHNHGTTTKSFGRITEAEADGIRANKIPERIEKIFKPWYHQLFIGTPYHKTESYFLNKIKYLINGANEHDPAFVSSVPFLCDAHHIQVYLNENIKPIIDEWEQMGFED